MHDDDVYSALLGYYLGDGCVSRAPRYFALRVSCDQAWPGIIEDDEPAAFLRGLFHSDGCRVINTTRRHVVGETKTYHYPRWQFVNASRGTQCSSLVKCA